MKLKTTELENYKDVDMITIISTYMNEVRPEILILPDYNDAHSDHSKVFKWCFACTKTFRVPFLKTILTMEILSETDFGRPDSPFNPQLFVDITNFFDKKVKAMKIYKGEMQPYPFPRSEEAMEALAKLRGVSAGVKYAESFRILKTIVK